MSAEAFTTEFHTISYSEGIRKIAFSRSGEYSAKHFFVCLPGLLETRDSFHLLLSLVKNYSDCCWISIDYCGRGLSDPLPTQDQYTTSKYIDDVENLVEQLGLQKSKISEKKIHLIGTSMGGILAMHIAKRKRIHLDSIILNDIGLLLQWNALLSLYHHLYQSDHEISQLQVDRRAIEAVQKRSHFDLPYDFDLTGMRFESLLDDFTGQIALLHNSLSPICSSTIANHSKSRLPELKVWTSENHAHPVQWNRALVNKLAQLTNLKLKPIEIIKLHTSSFMLDSIQSVIDIRSVADNVISITKKAFLEENETNRKSWHSLLLNKFRLLRRIFPKSLGIDFK